MTGENVGDVGMRADQSFNERLNGGTQRPMIVQAGWDA